MYQFVVRSGRIACPVWVVCHLTQPCVSVCFVSCLGCVLPGSKSAHTTQTGHTTRAGHTRSRDTRLCLVTQSINRSTSSKLVWYLTPCHYILHIQKYLWWLLLNIVLFNCYQKSVIACVHIVCMIN